LVDGPRFNGLVKCGESAGDQPRAALRGAAHGRGGNAVSRQRRSGLATDPDDGLDPEGLRERDCDRRADLYFRSPRCAVAPGLARLMGMVRG